MRGITVNVPNIGEANLETSYQNNMFSFHWGTYGVIVIEFNDSWSWRHWRPEGGSFVSNVDTTPISERPSPQLVLDFAQTVLDNPEMMQKLEKWRKDAIKRLVKSVPRLKEEYEGAAKRLESLKNADFSTSQKQRV